MVSVAEIQKERILCKKESPIRSGALEALLSKAKLMAKADGKDVVEPYIKNAASILIKENMKAITPLRDDFSDRAEQLVLRYFKEIDVFKEFAPVYVSEDRLRNTITDYIYEAKQKGEEVNIGKIMKMVGYVFGDEADKGMASRLAKELLK